MIKVKKLSVFLALTLPVIVTILAIWLPFGFALTGLIEEWGVLKTFVSSGLYFIATPDSPLAEQSLRPLTILPHAIAYLLDPHSFDYWNVLLMFALLIKGSAASHLIWKASGSLKWAVLMGVFVLIYPADTMQFSFRCLHINWAVALLLLASSLVLIAYEKKNTFSSYVLSLLGGILLFASCCMYEAALTLVFLPHLILFARDGFKVLWQAFTARLGLGLIWFSGAVFYLLYVMMLFPKLTGSYQGGLIRDPLTTFFSNLPKLFCVGALRGLFGGWFDAVRMVSTEFSGYVYLIVATAAICTFFLVKANAAFKPKLLPLRLGGAGLLLTLLGYMPFLFNDYFTTTSQRTFYWVTPGAALVWISLLILISRDRKWLLRFVVPGFIFFGLGSQLFQFHHYVKLCDTQRTLLKSIVENFDGKLENKTLLIQDKSNQLGSIWILPKEYLSNALSYLYGHPIDSVEICRLPSCEWQTSLTESRRGVCIEKESSWVFRFLEPVSGSEQHPIATTKDLEVVKDEVITLCINFNGSSSLNLTFDDHIKKLLKEENASAIRYRRVLARNFSLFNFGLFKDQHPQDRYRWNFGKWWGLDLPIRGAGWNGVEWTINNFFHQSWARQSQRRATLHFDLTPAQGRYFVRGKFAKIKDLARKGMQISINQSEIACEWISKEEFQGEIDPEILLSGVNEIAFNSPNASLHSVRLVWFEVCPK